MRLNIFLFVLIILITSVALSSVYISETNFKAPGNGNIDLNGEWVRISNSGETPVSSCWVDPI